jgi:hypothetical protein
MVLVGQQPDLATLLVIERAGTAQQGCRALRPERTQFAATKPETLRQDEQRPRRQLRTLAVLHAGVAGLGKRDGDMPPAIVNVRGRPGELRAHRGEQFFRQLSVAAGVSHGQFGRVTSKVLAEFGEWQRQTPDAVHQMFGMQTFEDQSYRQQIGQPNRRVVAGGM